MRRRKFIASVAAWCAAGACAASEQDASQGDDASMGMPNLKTPTLGGLQFWGDDLYFHDWRIQRHAVTGHCRLLDGRNRRHAWGSYSDCAAKLDDIKRQQQLPPMAGAGVIVLHGLGRTSHAMRGMAGMLRAQGGYTVFNVSYPTTRTSIDRHAEALASIIDHLDGIDEISFVAHSLGNLVIRRYLSMAQLSGQSADPRIKRIVMLAPPNQGSRLAEVMGRNPIYSLLLGPAGTDIARNWTALDQKLAVPACEFGIIAGGRNSDRGYNPLLGEDNDLIVSVATTRLGGAADFIVLPTSHTFIMDDPRVQESTLRFLQHGYFIGPDKRQAIPIDEVADGARVDRK